MDFDPDKLTKILSNLISNAIKFTPKGGSIKLYVEHILNPKELCQISVSDTGQGIPSEMIPYIFDRFYQADSGNERRHHSANEIQQGSGIGLTYTRELVQLMGGTIEVKSEVKKGTRFTISLPKTNQSKAYSFDNEVKFDHIQNVGLQQDIKKSINKVLNKEAREELPHLFNC